ncbi:MAG: peroxiredoxin [Hyphomicrobium sp.]
MTSVWPYPAYDDDGQANHLVPGLAVPAVTLTSTLGGRVNLGTRKGRAVLFVYPWTGRPGLPNPPQWDEIPGAHGSTPEAEGFRDLYASFQDAGHEIFGLSGQGETHQREFAIRVGLPFALLSDEAQEFGRALALPAFATGGVTYLKRLTLLLRDGVIERAIYPVHPPHTHAASLLASLV